jgi:hypothetical protein
MKMKISKLYSNNANFKSIIFDKGMNFILSNDHNVGKSSLLKLIDFCLLGNKSFLSQEQFSNDIFYIEVQIGSNQFITIKRPTIGGKNIELKVTKQKSMLLDETNFNKKGSLGVAKSFFEGKANYSINKFRTYIAYFLRDTNNQSDVFMLNKHSSSHEIEYKTVLSNLVGIDGRKIKRKYELDNEISKLESGSIDLKTKKNDLEKVIEENKLLISSYFIDNLKMNIAKYGNIILDKEISLSISFNTLNDIEFSMKIENNHDIDPASDDDNTINKLFCLIFESALAETYERKRLIKFVAFDSPFDGEKNRYEDGILSALHELNRKGIQTIITSREESINNWANLSDIKDNYIVRHLSKSDKLLGDF